MPVWIEIIVVLQLAAIIGLIVIVIFRRDSCGDSVLKTVPQTIELVYSLSGRTDLKIDQLTTKYDQFAVTSAQSTSSLRIELLAASSTEFSNLRQEVVNSITQIGSQTSKTLEELRASTNERLDKLTGDLTVQQASLRDSINTQLSTFQSEVTNRFNEFQKTQTEQGNASRESIDGTLSRLSRDIRETVNELKTDVNNRINEMAQQTTALRDSAEAQQTILRQTVEGRFDKLNESVAKKLDEMRETVDEKLHKTLESRLTQSFGLVTDQLGKVQTGLGEMKELATGVGDLKRLLINVRSRGTAGERFSVEMLLEQMLAPNQYIKNAHIKSGSSESVEFAVRIPNGEGIETLLPIDAKFPKEDWERLEEAASRNDKEAVSIFRAKLFSRIRTEAKKIFNNYVSPPITTDVAILCLATEGLYAEVHTSPGLVEELRSEFGIIVAGPTTLMAILSSLQMAFRSLALQQKGSEIMTLLSETKSEFGKFGVLMNKVEKQVGTVQNTLKEVGVRTRAINKTLSGVEVLEMGPQKAVPLIEFSSNLEGESGEPWEEVADTEAEETEDNLN
jgi:DNA recombination protein RmuC